MARTKPSKSSNDLLSNARHGLVHNKKNDRERRKEDALALAELAYDIFKEQKNGVTRNGQKNANTDPKV